MGVERGAWVLAAALFVGQAVAADEPLLAAIERGDPALSRELIAKGADIHARSSNGETALHLAALHDDPYYELLECVD
jgi:ankyrin repeat protein